MIKNCACEPEIRCSWHWNKRPPAIPAREKRLRALLYRALPIITEKGGIELRRDIEDALGIAK